MVDVYWLCSITCFSLNAGLWTLILIPHGVEGWEKTQKPNFGIHSILLQNVVNLSSTSIAQDSLAKSFYTAMKISRKLLAFFLFLFKVTTKNLQWLHYFPSQYVNPQARIVWSRYPTGRHYQLNEMVLDSVALNQFLFFKSATDQNTEENKRPLTVWFNKHSLPTAQWHIKISTTMNTVLLV